MASSCVDWSSSCDATRRRVASLRAELRRSWFQLRRLVVEFRRFVSSRDSIRHRVASTPDSIHARTTFPSEQSCATFLLARIEHDAKSQGAMHDHFQHQKGSGMLLDLETEDPGLW